MPSNLSLFCGSRRSSICCEKWINRSATCSPSVRIWPYARSTARHRRAAIPAIEMRAAGGDTANGRKARAAHLVEQREPHRVVRGNHDLLPERSRRKPVAIQVIGEQAVDAGREAVEVRGLDDH